MTEAAQNDAPFDPWEFGPRIRHEELREMRRSCPVARGAGDSYFLSRYPDVELAFRDQKHFKNEGGVGPPGLQIPLEDQFINERDGEAHLRIRRITQRALAIAGALQVGPFVRLLSERLIEAAKANGQADLMVGLCREIPPRVVTHLMHLSEESHAKLVRWVSEVQFGDFFTTTTWRAHPDSLQAAYPEFAAYLDEEIDARRRSTEPPTDFISGLMAASEELGYELTQIELRQAIAHMMLAASDTTSQLLGNLLYELIRAPELYRQVRADRDLVPVAVEESLRHDPPAAVQFRKTATEVEVAGETIEAGARVAISVASANRDEGYFDASDEFRLDRPQPMQHLAFGRGRHLCLGNDLARLEAATMLNAFLDLVEHVRLADGFEYVKEPPFFACGPVTLDVVFD
jgi:cytochrome P450